MIQNRALKIFLIFIILSHAFRISTFAGQRKGLVADFGCGYGSTYRKAGNNWFTVHNTRFNIANEARLGFASTKQLQFFL